MIESSAFYPETVKTAADRLCFYASVFPIVEVDAPYYALPSERNAHLWVERSPPGFLFNIEAFGLFTHHPVPIERLPEAVKELLSRPLIEKKRVYLSDVPEEARTQALAPLASSAASCFSSRIGSPRGETISTICSGFANAPHGRLRSSSAVAAG